MNQKDYNENRELLFDWIDEQWALRALMPGYIMDLIDADKERCFV